MMQTMDSPLRITGTTSVYGIFGDPVAHSLSPRMQNAAFTAAGLDAVYVPFHVPVDSLPAAVAALRTLGVCGINATIPHKEAILPLLDTVDPDALLIGAVNTVVQDGGRLYGYNTDAPGFLRAVCEETGFVPQGADTLLLGAGGACRAAVMALARAGVRRIVVANRTVDRAEQILTHFRAQFRTTEFISAPLDASLPTRFGGSDLLVNTSAVGLHGEAFEFPLLTGFSATTRVYDMVYCRTGATPFVVDARQRGMTAAGGLSMLAAQGEEAFRLWTGNAPPLGVMKMALMSSN